MQFFAKAESSPAIGDSLEEKRREAQERQRRKQRQRLHTGSPVAKTQGVESFHQVVAGGGNGDRVTGQRGGLARLRHSQDKRIDVHGARYRGEAVNTASPEACSHVVRSGKQNDKHKCEEQCGR